MDRAKRIALIDAACADAHALRNALARARASAELSDRTGDDADSSADAELSECVSAAAAVTDALDKLQRGPAKVRTAQGRGGRVPVSGETSPESE